MLRRSVWGPEENGSALSHRIVVSAAGKALLARLHDDGAQLMGRACMTSAIIEKIVTRARMTAPKKRGR